MQCIKTRIEWLKRIIAAVTGTCIFGDAATFLSFTWRYFYCAFLGSSLGIFDSNCNQGWGNLVTIDWNLTANF